ncbi:transcriptional regulator [Pontibacillus yanchengensis Y32]|uniref:Transcriptional regulator n=2 Tax=Pontibacillus yanchengensis TaxID=462910 RepID=A0A0A2TI33_9BACI|nr:PadR family transcriptional regulator [Pontibacillus yanchengensis]KGP73726.1 transcriptional regulator [Pontibacillus yanchengensis Y32]
MVKENHTKYAILGLLTTECRTGYQIKQMIDGSLNHFWKISYGQVYPILKTLVEDGDATVHETEQEGKPNKKEYHITQQGQNALQVWIEKPVLELPTEKNELLLKLFFGRHQDANTNLHLLETYLTKLTERYRTYEGIKTMIQQNYGQEEDAVFWIITLDYGLMTTKAAMDWCKQTMDLITNQREDS